MWKLCIFCHQITQVCGRMEFLVIVLGNPCLAAGCTFPVTFSLGILRSIAAVMVAIGRTWDVFSSLDNLDDVAL